MKVTEKSGKGGKRKEIQSELIVRETKTESSEQKIRDRRKLVPKQRMEKSDSERGVHPNNIDTNTKEDRKVTRRRRGGGSPP